MSDKTLDGVVVENVALRIGQSEVDKRAEELFERIMYACSDIAKQRKGLQVARIYLGVNEFNTLRCWTGIHRWYHREPQNDTLAGHPIYRADQMDHFYIAWE